MDADVPPVKSWSVYATGVWHLELLMMPYDHGEGGFLATMLVLPRATRCQTPRPERTFLSLAANILRREQTRFGPSWSSWRRWKLWTWDVIS